jgi:hypothetical protein
MLKYMPICAPYTTNAYYREKLEAAGGTTWTDPEWEDAERLLLGLAEEDFRPSVSMTDGGWNRGQVQRLLEAIGSSNGPVSGYEKSEEALWDDLVHLDYYYGREIAPEFYFGMPDEFSQFKYFLETRYHDNVVRALLNAAATFGRKRIVEFAETWGRGR